MAEQGGGRAPQDRHSAPARKRKRGLSDDAVSSRTVHETEEQAQIERLPFEGGLLSQQAHSQVRYKNNGANHKDHLELIGHGNSAVNWIAPERQIKKPGLQLVAKIALDDESFEAFKKTIQREARGAGGVLANIWVQIHEAPSSEEETPNVVNEESSAADVADKESLAPVVTEAMPVQGGFRPLSSGPSDPFRFGPPSSFTGTSCPSQVLPHVAAVGAAVADDPFAEKWVNMGILPPRKRKYKAVSILGLPVRKENPALPEPQPSPVSCPHCRLHARQDANTHELRDCGYASPKGDIPGCPVCNTLKHFYDACKKRKESGEDRRHEDWKFLVEYRSGLPPLRTKTAWPDLVTSMQATHGFPITKAMALQVRDNHRHGTKYQDPLTRTLGDVRMNLERLRASEVFTGMGNQSVNRPSNGAGTSGSNAMELNNAPAFANVPAPSTESVQAVQTVEASFAAPAVSSAPAPSSSAPAGPVAPAPSSALAGPVAPAAPAQSEAVTEMADTVDADGYHFSTVRIEMDTDGWAL